MAVAIPDRAFPQLLSYFHSSIIRQPHSSSPVKAMHTEVPAIKRPPVEVVEYCVAYLQKADNAGKAKPLAQKQLDSLKLGDKVLPPSLKRFLAFDSTFESLYSEWGVFERLGAINPQTGNWATVSAEEEIALWIQSLTRRPAAKLKLTDSSCNPLKSVADYLAVNLSGALFPLPNMGDQTHYLYAGQCDDHQELPVIAFEMQGDLEDEDSTVFWGQLHVWVKYPNFATYLYDQLFDEDAALDGFKSEIEQIIARNPEFAGK